MEYEHNPVKAIRKKCLDCSEDYIEEVRNCPIESCPIWPFRFGKNPYRTAPSLTEEQKEARSNRMKELRQLQLANASKVKLPNEDSSTFEMN